MKLTLVIFAIGSGGAERVMTTMANYWANAGWRLELLTFDDGSKRPFYPLHSSIVHRPLGVAGRTNGIFAKLIHNARRLRMLRKSIRRHQPDAVIAFMDTTNVAVLLASVGLGVPVVVSERVDPGMQKLPWIWRWLRRFTYPWASALVCQSMRALNTFPPAIAKKGWVIPNFVPARRILHTDSRHQRKIVAMGRLCPQKGFDLLLNAFASIAERHPKWVLEIWGEGSERERLEEQLSALGLTGRAILAGVTSEPFKVLGCADLFVLSSRYEGFPNALCEAMACGVASISFDCPSGPREIIRQEVDGVLVPEGDVAALACAMERLIEDEETRVRLAKRASEIVVRFETTKIMAQWERVLKR